MEILQRSFDADNIRRTYRKVIWFYDFWSWLTESKAAEKIIDLAEITDGESVLEVACGTGIVFAKIAMLNPDGSNIGIDLSPDMLKKAKKRLERVGLSNGELKEGNALGLDFEDNRFDLVVNNFMVDLMPVKTFDRIASEFYRVTKPGGRVLISTFSFGKKKINRFWFLIAKTLPALLTGCRPVSFSQYLEDAGFEIEEIIELSQNTFPSEVIKARKPA